MGLRPWLPIHPVSLARLPREHDAQGLGLIGPGFLGFGRRAITTAGNFEIMPTGIAASQGGAIGRGRNSESRAKRPAKAGQFWESRMNACSERS